MLTGLLGGAPTVLGLTCLAYAPVPTAIIPPTPTPTPTPGGGGAGGGGSGGGNRSYQKLLDEQGTIACMLAVLLGEAE